jgi:sterol desaturase/sphingolipid hydroxylase (fatty acid hydroxylase superfamily)
MNWGDRVITEDSELLKIEAFLYNSFFPSIFIFKILVSSTLTAFFICKVLNKPFMNPGLYAKHKTYLMDKMKIVVGVGKTVIFNYNIIYFFLSQYHLHHENTYVPTRILNVIKFLFMLEFIAYGYHRLSHEIQYIYKNSHKYHHMNIEVYPIDFLEFDYIDNIAQTLYVNLPLYFVPMNIDDYAMIYYIYATCAFLIHSDIINKDHMIHHRRFKYNYSLLIPVFDILFGTYLSEK